MDHVIAWSEEYDVGLEEINDQHKQLIQFINDLSFSLQREGSEKNIEMIINRMVDYVVYHFNTEEKYLIGRPHYHEHCRQHDIYTKKVLMYRDAVIDSPESVGDDAVKFLKKWLHEHILGLDKKEFEALRRESNET